MPHQYLESVCRPGQAVNPLFAFLGIEILELESDRAVLRLEIKPDFIQGAGNAAGGIIATLLDEAMAHAVLAGNPAGKRTTTVDMDVRYYRPVGEGDVITCEGEVAKRGSRIVFTKASVMNNGKEAAHATASFMIV